MPKECINLCVWVCILLPFCFRPEMVVGWYHSHPGFGCWLSNVDIQTHQGFEQLHPRAVAVVVDPIQSVKGKVVMDAFRLIKAETAMMSREYKQTTSNVGHLQKPTIVALVHGLNRYYYSMPIETRKTETEQKMLMSLNKKSWNAALHVPSFVAHSAKNVQYSGELLRLAEAYTKSIQEEVDASSPDALKLRHVGKQDPKRHLDEKAVETIAANVVQNIGSMLYSLAL